jgi:hypothetical protein
MTLKLARPRHHNILILPAILVLIVGLFIAIPVQAGIVSSSGVTQLASPPAGDVHPGTNTTTPTPIIFPEVLGGVVPAGGVAVDHNGSVAVASPVVSANLVNSTLVAGSIPAGTVVDSYLFHYDPQNPPISANFYDSTILFSNKILGVQLLTSSNTALQKPAATLYVGKLEAGDAAVAAMSGPPVGYYPTGLSFRGEEEDAMQITNGGFGIELAGEVDGAEIDQVRIFVAVPEPHSVLLALMGLLGLPFLAIKNARAVRC